MVGLRPASPGLFLCLFSSNHDFDGVHSVAVPSSSWNSRSSRTQRSSKQTACIRHWVAVQGVLQLVQATDAIQEDGAARTGL
jgi:hypothetical protein